MVDKKGEIPTQMKLVKKMANSNIFRLTKKRVNTNINTNIQTGIRKYKYKYEYLSHTAPIIHVKSLQVEQRMLGGVLDQVIIAERAVQNQDDLVSHHML